MNLFSQIIEKIFSGNCDVEEYKLTNVKINKLNIDLLANYKDYKPSISFYNDKIVESMLKIEGFGLSLFPNWDIMLSLLDPLFEELREEINTYEEDIYNVVNQLLKTIINKFYLRFPKILNSAEKLRLKNYIIIYQK